jgi:inosine-uridine nucleoside N-ribohydrolase
MPSVVAIIMAFLTVGVVAPASGAAASVTRHRPSGPRRAVPNVIIDTDLSRWWDDATAIGLANILQQQGKVHVLGIVSDVPNRVEVAAIDAIDTAYGHPRIPLGAVANSAADTFRHGYTDELALRLPHSVRDSNDVPNAVSLYRRLLARQPDHSVTIVSLGGYTNLAGLLASRGHGHALDGEFWSRRK